MERERIIGILREHKTQLQAEGLLHLRLFGSVARGESSETSDVDLLFECDDSDFHNVLRSYGYEDEVTRILGVKAHLSFLKNMRPDVREKVLPEIVDVF